MPPGADIERIIRQQARTTGLPLMTVQTDYALSYVLAGIAAVPQFYDIALFKGGTSLRKAYFRDYRFSEDLDYTLLGALGCADLSRLLREAGTRAGERLNERGPFVVEVDEVQHRAAHERGQCQFKIRVQFPSMRTPQCVLKVEVLPAPPEVVAGTPQELDLIHAFDEDLAVRMRCYQLEEIAAEKLRGFLQTRARFEDTNRAWVRTRPRDLYDLSHLRRQTRYALDRRTIRAFLEKKCPPYGVTFKDAEDFLDARVLDGLRREWDGSLGTFVRQLPTFDECLADHRALLAEVLTA